MVYEPACMLKYQKEPRYKNYTNRLTEGGEGGEGGGGDINHAQSKPVSFKK